MPEDVGKEIVFDDRPAVSISIKRNTIAEMYTAFGMAVVDTCSRYPEHMFMWRMLPVVRLYLATEPPACQITARIYLLPIQEKPFVERG